MQRELSSFPLAPHHLNKLTNRGYLKAEDLKDVSPIELSEDLGYSREEALKIIQTVRESSNESVPKSDKSKSKSRNAYELLQQEQSAGSVVTFCENLDDMLGGGVPIGKITEFCGAPGIGKTQIGMQLAVDVQMPQEFGGLAGEAIYIDTEGSFIVDRVVDIAEAAIRHLEHVSSNPELEKSERDSLSKSLKVFNIDGILSRIYVFRCHDYMQLMALSHLLPDFLREHVKVKLIVLDSIAFHFRHDFEDLAHRTRLLSGLAQSFIKMACEQQIAVVLMNQMTTRIHRDQLRQSHLIPALGESWGHASTVRVVLFWDRNQRYANLYKSPSRQEMTVPFHITTSGVRDAEIRNVQAMDVNTNESQAAFSITGHQQDCNSPGKQTNAGVVSGEDRCGNAQKRPFTEVS